MMNETAGPSRASNPGTTVDRDHSRRRCRELARSVAGGLLPWLLAGGVAGQQPVTLVPHAARDIDGATALALSPEGDVVAVATSRQVVLLAADDLAQLQTLDVPAAPTAIAVDASGTRMYVGDRRNRVHAFDAGTGRMLGSATLPARPTALDVSANGAFVSVGLADGRIHVLTDGLKQVRQLRAADFHRREVIFVAWGQGDGELFAATAEGATAYWSTESPDPVRSSSPNRTTIIGAARDFSGDMLAVGLKAIRLIRERGAMAAEAQYSVDIVDWATGRKIATVEAGAAEIRSVAVAPIRTAIATADARGEITIWDVRRGAGVTNVQGAASPTDLAFSTDARWLAMLSEGGRLQLWQASGLSASSPVASVDATRAIRREKFEVTTDDAPLIGRAESFRIAILGLDNLGVDSVFARTADNLLASQVAGVSNVTLVEKDALDRVMRELRFQNSGITTNDEAARIGAMLNASKVIVGSVNQLGTVLIISARVVAVETGGVDGAREVRCNDCRPEDLQDAIRVLVQTLFEM